MSILSRITSGASTLVKNIHVTQSGVLLGRYSSGAGKAQEITLGSGVTVTGGELTVAPAWSDITGKPSTFTPTTHVHSASDVTSGTFGTARLGAFGTASGGTYLRGDSTWSSIDFGHLSGSVSSSGALSAALDAKASLAGTNDLSGTNRFSGPITFNIGSSFAYDTGVAALHRTALGAQATLVSGTNIKTVNGTSLLGSGDLSVAVTNTTVNTALAEDPAATRAAMFENYASDFLAAVAGFDIGDAYYNTATSRARSVQVGIDPLVSTYSAANSLTLSNLGPVNAALSYLRENSLLPDDAVFLRTNQQASATSPTTINGVTGTTGNTPVLTTNGMEFATSAKWAKWALTADTAFTIVADIEGVTSGQTSDAWIAGMVNNAGVTTTGQALNLYSTASAYGYTREGGTVTTTTAIADNGEARIIGAYNPIPQIAAFSYDDEVSPTVKIHVDGVSVLTDSSGNTRSTSDLDRLQLGSRYLTGSSYDAAFRGKCGLVFFYKRVLTDAEQAIVARAVRMADPRTHNVIVQGDSLTAQFADSTKGIGNWPCWMIRRNAARNNAARLVNAAKNGTQSSWGISNFPTLVAPWLPDGKVCATAHHIVMYGTNDLLSSADSAATIYARIVALSASAKAAGNVTTACMTVLNAQDAGLDAGQETRRLALNALIRAGEGTDFDVVIDTNEIDIIAGAVAAFYTDDLHPNPTGNRIIAQHVAAALELPGGIPRNTVMPVITGTAAVDAVLTASSGTWTATPSSYAYQWTQDGADISGATTATYTVLAGDSGKRVACRVTATNASGEAEMTSLQTLIP